MAKGKVAHRGRLYHYTTAQGLEGIINTWELWATDVRFMNDGSEIQYPLRIFKEAMNGLPSEISRAKLSTWWRLMDVAQAFITPKDDTLRFYAACFCEDGDLLSQWRGYGEHGGGFALGFDVDTMIDRGAAPVVYKTSDQVARVTEVLNRHWKWLADQVSETGEAGTELSTLLLELLPQLMLLKRRHFQEESEWRIRISAVGPSFGGVRVKVAGNRLVPYTPLQFMPDEPALTEIVIGPRPKREQRLAASAVKALLRQYKRPDVRISVSDIPLRL